MRRVAEGEPFVELGDDVTGPLRVPIEYAEPSAVEDARLLERASDECVSLARTDPQSAHARALGLVGILRSFEEELRRVARSEPDDEASGGNDADLAESLVSARLSLEEVLMELPDNGALAQALRELDESLAEAGEATLFVDPRDYEERIARVVPLPGRWWSLRAELDEVLPDHLLERLREAPVQVASHPSATAVREPAEAYGAAPELAGVVRLVGPLRSDLALAAATGGSGALAERSLPGGGTLCFYRDADDALHAQVIEAGAPGPYLLSWGSAEAQQVRVELRHGTWEAGPIDESVLDAAELTLRPLGDRRR